MIKNKLAKSNPAAPVLLDWKGKIHLAYGTQKRTPNLYLVDRDGRLAYHIDANFDPQAYLQLQEAIEGLQPVIADEIEARRRDERGELLE